MKRFVVAAVAALTLSLVVNASIVTLNATVDLQSKTWKLYASVSSDCAGLSSFDINQIATTGDIVNVLPAQMNMAPAPTEYSGFSYELQDGALQASQLSSWQPSATGYNKRKSANVIQGFGILDTTVTRNMYPDPSTGVTATAITYTLSTNGGLGGLIAQGEYSGDFGSITFAGNGTVLKGADGDGWTGPDIIAEGDNPQESVTWVPATINIPEPATMSLLGLGALALVRRRC